MAMLAGMNVEHKINKRPLKPRTRSVQDRKTRTSYLSSSFEVENPQSFAKIDVVLRFEIELASLTPSSDLLVRGLVSANRHVRGRHIRQASEQLAHSGIHFVSGILELCLLVP